MKKSELRFCVVIFYYLMIIFNSSCIRSEKHPGYDYYPDMTNSMAYEPYSGNTYFPDSMTQQNPVEGTISRNRPAHYSSKRESDRYLSGKMFANPVVMSDRVIENGGLNFEVICSVCHGVKGDGKGILVTSGKYMYFPADLTRDEIKDFKDGELFNVITEGFGLMGAHGSILTPAERWEIIHYIKESL